MTTNPLADQTTSLAGHERDNEDYDDYQPGVGWSLWGQRLVRLFSFRVWIGTGFAWVILYGLIFFALNKVFGITLTEEWEHSTGGRILYYLMFVPWVLSVLVWVFNDDQVLRCPWCRKRVKLGATACHHCGRSTAYADR